MTARERPILFGAPMVRAILEGRKTQTRRVVKAPRGHELVNLRESEGDHSYSGLFNDPTSWGYPFFDDCAPAVLAHWPELCPYGQPGDRLWVRETWAHVPASAYRYSDGVQQTVCPSDPDMAAVYAAGWDRSKPGRWRPSIHMPRWASRIDLEVTVVRVERLQDISEADAIAESIQASKDGHGFHTEDGRHYWSNAVGAYCSQWESINGPDSWTANPWVWVVEFRRVKP